MTCDAIYKLEGKAILDPVGKFIIGNVTGAYLVVDRKGTTFIRSAADSFASGAGRNNVFPKEHQNSSSCLHVNKAVNTHFNT